MQRRNFLIWVSGFFIFSFLNRYSAFGQSTPTAKLQEGNLVEVERNVLWNSLVPKLTEIEDVESRIYEKTRVIAPSLIKHDEPTTRELFTEMNQIQKSQKELAADLMLVNTFLKDHEQEQQLQVVQIDVLNAMKEIRQGFKDLQKKNKKCEEIIAKLQEELEKTPI